MVNEAVPKFAVGSSTGFMGFFQYIFGETLATALIGILVAKYGWLASNMVLYTASALALLSVVLKRLPIPTKRIKFSLKQGLEEFLALFFDLIYDSQKYFAKKC